MAQERVDKLFASESWNAVYTAFTNISLKAYDFNDIREALITYVRNTYPDKFNDFIASSEFIAILDLVAYLGHSLAFRLDMNTRENFFDLAERRESILRMAKTLSYNRSRPTNARGFMKIVSIQTSENIVDSDGNPMRNIPIYWNDVNVVDWYDNFVSILNAALNQNSRVGDPDASATFLNIEHSLHSINEDKASKSVVYRSATDIAGKNRPIEIVRPEITSDGVIEAEPDKTQNMGIIYRNDNLGAASNRSGFFVYAKLGTLKYKDFNYTRQVSNRTESILDKNISNTDVWVQKLDYNNNIMDSLFKVDNNTRENAIYHSFKDGTNNLFAVNTFPENIIEIQYPDGLFGVAPYGKYRVWYRTTDNEDFFVDKDDIEDIKIIIPYVGNNGRSYKLTMTLASSSDFIENFSAETYESVRRLAPQNYYTQDRMTNVQDYNIYPLTLGTSVVSKIKSFNTTYAGKSRYMDIDDVTGHHSSVSVNGTDGSIFMDTETKYIRFDFNREFDNIQKFITSDISNLLSNFSLLNHYYYTFKDSQFVTIDLADSYWAANTTDSLSGIITVFGLEIEDVTERSHFLIDDEWYIVMNVDDVSITLDRSPPTVGTATKYVKRLRSQFTTTEINNITTFISNLSVSTFTLFYNIETDVWAVTEGEITSAISLTFEYIVGSRPADTEYLVKFPGGDLVFESAGQVKFYYGNHSPIPDVVTGLSERDQLFFNFFNSDAATETSDKFLSSSEMNIGCGPVINVNELGPDGPIDPPGPPPFIAEPPPVIWTDPPSPLPIHIRTGSVTVVSTDCDETDGNDSGGLPILGIVIDGGTVGSNSGGFGGSYLDDEPWTPPGGGPIVVPDDGIQYYVKADAAWNIDTSSSHAEASSGFVEVQAGQVIDVVPYSGIYTSVTIDGDILIASNGLDNSNNFTLLDEEFILETPVLFDDEGRIHHPPTLNSLIQVGYPDYSVAFAQLYALDQPEQADGIIGQPLIGTVGNNTSGFGGAYIDSEPWTSAGGGAITIPTDGRQYYVKAYAAWKIDISSSHAEASSGFVEVQAGQVIDVVPYSGIYTSVTIDGDILVASSGLDNSNNFTPITGKYIFEADPLIYDASAELSIRPTAPGSLGGDYSYAIAQIYVVDDIGENIHTYTNPTFEFGYALSPSVISTGFGDDKTDPIVVPDDGLQYYVESIYKWHIDISSSSGGATYGPVEVQAGQVIDYSTNVATIDGVDIDETTFTPISGTFPPMTKSRELDITPGYVFPSGGDYSVLLVRLLAYGEDIYGTGGGGGGEGEAVVPNTFVYAANGACSNTGTGPYTVPAGMTHIWFQANIPGISPALSVYPVTAGDTITYVGDDIEINGISAGSAALPAIENAFVYTPGRFDPTESLEFYFVDVLPNYLNECGGTDNSFVYLKHVLVSDDETGTVVPNTFDYTANGTCSNAGTGPFTVPSGITHIWFQAENVTGNQAPALSVYPVTTGDTITYVGDDIEINGISAGSAALPAIENAFVYTPGRSYSELLDNYFVDALPNFLNECSGTDNSFVCLKPTQVSDDESGTVVPNTFVYTANGACSNAGTGPYTVPAGMTHIWFQDDTVTNPNTILSVYPVTAGDTITYVGDDIEINGISAGSAALPAIENAFVYTPGRSYSELLDNYFVDALPSFLNECSGPGNSFVYLKHARVREDCKLTHTITISESEFNTDGVEHPLSIEYFEEAAADGRFFFVDEDELPSGTSVEESEITDNGTQNDFTITHSDEEFTFTLPESKLPSFVINDEDEDVFFKLKAYYYVGITTDYDVTGDSYETILVDGNEDVIDPSCYDVVSLGNDEYVINVWCPGVIGPITVGVAYRDYETEVIAVTFDADFGMCNANINVDFLESSPCVKNITYSHFLVSPDGVELPIDPEVDTIIGIPPDYLVPFELDPSDLIYDYTPIDNNVTVIVTPGEGTVVQPEPVEVPEELIIVSSINLPVVDVIGNIITDDEDGNNTDSTFEIPTPATILGYGGGFGVTYTIEEPFTMPDGGAITIPDDGKQYYVEGYAVWNIDTSSQHSEATSVPVKVDPGQVIDVEAWSGQYVAVTVDGEILVTPFGTRENNFDPFVGTSNPLESGPNVPAELTPGYPDYVWGRAQIFSYGLIDDTDDTDDDNTDGADAGTTHTITLNANELAAAGFIGEPSVEYFETAATAGNFFFIDEDELPGGVTIHTAEITDHGTQTEFMVEKSGSDFIFTIPEQSSSFMIEQLDNDIYFKQKSTSYSVIITPEDLDDPSNNVILIDGDGNIINDDCYQITEVGTNQYTITFWCSIPTSPIKIGYGTLDDISDLEKFHVKVLASFDLYEHNIINTETYSTTAGYIHDHYVNNHGYINYNRVHMTSESVDNNPFGVLGAFNNNETETSIVLETYYDHNVEYEKVSMIAVSSDSREGLAGNVMLWYNTNLNTWYLKVNNHWTEHFLYTEISPTEIEYPVDNGRRYRVVPGISFVEDPYFSYRWDHFANEDRRIDPSTSNIIDVYVLTTDYVRRVNSWIAGGFKTRIPTPTNSYELRKLMSTIKGKEAMADHVSYIPVRFKYIFGEQADVENQVVFKAIKRRGTTYTDSEVKSVIASKVNEYFRLENWNFGDVFYYSQLVGYLHNELSDYIDTVIITPKYASSEFSDLLSISSNLNEVFMSVMTSNNVKLITRITPEELIGKK